MIVGEYYDKHNYNCAHAVASYYKRVFNIDIPVDNAFSIGFVKWMMKHFTHIDKPVKHCLVYMVNHDGSTHVGIYIKNGILHNYHQGKNGSVVHSEMSYIYAYYKTVRFYKWLK